MMSSTNAGMAPQHPLSPECMLIRDGAYWNREGATQLITGNLDTAIDRLMDGLETLSLAGGFHASPAIANAYATRSFPFDRQSPSSPLRSLAFQHPLPPQLPSNDCDDGSFFVYSNPFIFHPVTVDTPEYATNCTAVVLFNLALAWHQRGRRADSRALYRARSLYEMSLALVASMSCREACANLNVAATNNKAHVHFEVSDVGDAKNTLHALLTILGTNKSSPPPFGELEIEKFYMNILHLNGSTLAGAA